MATAEPITAATLGRAIATRYEPPEWHLEHEVTFEGRRIDVLAFNLWSARGHRVVAFEIKAERGDWLKELAQVQKNETWTRVVDDFYVVTPPKLVKPGEVPLTWGHLELAGSRLMTRQHPPKRAYGNTLPREVAARFFTRLSERVRRQDQTFSHELKRQVREEIEEATVKSIEARRAADLVYWKEEADEAIKLYEALGINRNDYDRLATAAALGKLIHAAGLDRPYFANTIKRMADEMVKASEPLRALHTLLTEPNDGEAQRD